MWLTAVEVDFENVDRVRRAAKDEFKAKEGFSLTYCRSCCERSSTRWPSSPS